MLTATTLIASFLAKSTSVHGCVELRKSGLNEYQQPWS